MTESRNALSSTMRLLIVQPHACTASETFIRAHSERLPAEVTVAFGATARVNRRPSRSQSFVSRAIRKTARLVRGLPFESVVTNNYLCLLRKIRPHAVLAEYGDMGVLVMDACRQANVPLVVHFHGYDASIHALLERMKEQYTRMFQRSEEHTSELQSLRH